MGAVSANAQIYDPVEWEATAEYVSENEATIVITATIEPGWHVYSQFNGNKISRIGQKWSDMQASVYGTNSQPYYVIVDHGGKQLIPPTAFDLNIENYAKFLRKGTEAFEKSKTIYLE